jgi:ribosomal protein S18 acetylase RimI-like enzyme
MAMANNESEGALPHGYYSEGHYFFHIEQGVTGERIGYVWYLTNMKRKTAFLYDIFINQEARGMGIASEVISLIEEKLRELGILSLRLNVFADNLTAKRLYEKAGFEPCNTIMQKQLN